eukprot:6004910-Lingulodinium_polyedra.AAC.1
MMVAHPSLQILEQRRREQAEAAVQPALPAGGPLQPSEPPHFSTLVDYSDDARHRIVQVFGLPEEIDAD